MSASYPTACPLEEQFRLGPMLGDKIRVLELGTCRWGPDPTHHERWAIRAAEYVKADITPGDDVDVVVDAHRLSDVFLPGWFDAIIAVSVLEHLERPWVAAQEMAFVLKPGGSLYVSTHQTFPVHGYPNDYFRFTDEGLKVLFGAPWFEVVGTSYAYEATILPHPAVTDWNAAAPAWLNVQIFSKRLP